MKRTALHSSSGFTLVEVMAALGVGAIAMLALISVMQITNKMSIGSRMQTSRDGVANNIRRYAANPHAMNLTMNKAANAALKSCIAGTSCTPDVPVGYALYDAAPVPTQLAGSSVASPLVYSIDGVSGTTSGGVAVCPTASLQCPILAATYFIPRCPTAGCTFGSSSNVTIETHYAVWQSPMSYMPYVSGNAMLKTIDSPPIPISAASVYNTP